MLHRLKKNAHSTLAIHQRNTHVPVSRSSGEGEGEKGWRGRTIPLSNRQSACVHVGSGLESGHNTAHKVTTHTGQRATRTPLTVHTRAAHHCPDATLRSPATKSAARGSVRRLNTPRSWKRRRTVIYVTGLHKQGND